MRPLSLAVPAFAITFLWASGAALAAPYARPTTSSLVTWSTLVPDADQIDVDSYPGAVMIESSSRLCAKGDDGTLQCPALSLPYVIIITKDPELKVLTFYRKHLPHRWRPVAKELSEATRVWSFSGPGEKLADGHTYSELLDLEPVDKELGSDEISAYLPGAQTWIKVTYIPKVMRTASKPSSINYPPARPEPDN